MKGIRQKLVSAVAFACLVSAFFALAQRLERVSGLDPDRYYHFALSREMAHSGKPFLRELPQVVGLGWDRFFADKEFLFHQFTAIGYRLGGDGGVVAAVWLIALAGILIFFFHAAGRIGGAWACLITLLFFGNPILLSRLVLLRPHVLAIGCFLLMLLSVVRERKALLFLSILLFTLSYHAFYIPVIVVAAAFLAKALSGETRGASDKSLLAFGGAGLLFGIFLNPYFPANLILSLRIAYIPSLMSGELKSLSFGAELYPLDSAYFLASFFLPLLVVAAAAWALGRGRRAGGSHNSVLFLMQVCLVCLVLSFKSRRGAEYFVPASAFLLVELLADSAFWRRPKWRSWIGGASFVVLAWFCFTFSAQMRNEPPRYAEVTLQAAQALPASGHAKVFNCEWDTTPYLFYARPNLRFLDILDPSLLYFADEKAHLARENLKKSEVADAYGLIHNAFRAQYVFCRNPNIVTQMERDPRFRRLYPRQVREEVTDDFTQFVYELKPEPGIEYVKRFELSFLPVSEQDYDLAGPSAAERKSIPANLTYSGYLNLGKIFQERIAKLPPGQALCARVVPDSRGLVGATYLALGGGRNIRLWKNGQPFFHSEFAYLNATMHQQIIPVGEPLRASDRLEFLVCSSKSANFWGFSLAGLTPAKFRSLCQWKREKESRPSEPFSFALGRRSQTCLGVVAQPGVPTELR